MNGRQDALWQKIKEGGKVRDGAGQVRDMDMCLAGTGFDVLSTGSWTQRHDDHDEE